MITELYWNGLLALPSLCMYLFDNRTMGLYSGLACVALGQCWTVLYFLSELSSESIYETYPAIVSHFTNVEGFVLLGTYLSVSWYGKWLPSSYYISVSAVDWGDVWWQLCIQDALQYAMHRLEHIYRPWYRKSHQYHHVHIRPRIFDAFDGAILDTISMILIPLWITAQCVHTNTESYMAFGLFYSVWLTLIHSDVPHSWEIQWALPMGIGTSLDHQIHHKFFKYNYGHVFMYWDYLMGTYKSPLSSSAPKAPTQSSS